MQLGMKMGEQGAGSREASGRGGGRKARQPWCGGGGGCCCSSCSGELRNAPDRGLGLACSVLGRGEGRGAERLRQHLTLHQEDQRWRHDRCNEAHHSMLCCGRASAVCTLLKKIHGEKLTRHFPCTGRVSWHESSVGTLKVFPDP